MRAYHVFTYDPESTGNNKYSLSEKTARLHFEALVKGEIEHGLEMIEYYKEEALEGFSDLYEKMVKEGEEGIERLKEITYDNFEDYGWSEMPNGRGIAWEIIEVIE